MDNLVKTFFIGTSFVLKITVICSIILFSCNSDEEPEPIVETQQETLQIKNVKWQERDSSVYYIITDNSFDVYDNNNLIREYESELLGDYTLIISKYFFSEEINTSVDVGLQFTGNNFDGESVQVRFEDRAIEIQHEYITTFTLIE